MESEEISSEAYIQHYRTCLRDFQAHLSGSDAVPTPVTLVSPASYWTQPEKDAFFHALSIHSRLRPDCIASYIPTKNVLEVCSFIDLLDDLASQTPLAEPRRNQPIAHEVSDEFIQWEQEQAHDIVGREILIPEPDSDDERDTQVSNVLMTLETAHLKILDAIIREGTHFHESLNKSVASLSPRPSPEAEPLAEGATQEPPSTSPSLEPTLDDMSPLSKRRHKNRLYMRKKRAEAVGAAVNSSVTKMRVGRNKKLRAPRKPRPKSYHKAGKSAPIVYDSDEFLEAGADGEGSQPKGHDEPSAVYARRGVGGTTKALKARRSFEAVDLSIDDLEERGLDFFRLARAGKKLT